MLTKEKCICIIEFLGKKTDQESWSEKFLSCGEQKGYKKLLVNSGSMSCMDKIPSWDEYQYAVEGDKDLDKNS